jgi:hypothetical protein
VAGESYSAAGSSDSTLRETQATDAEVGSFVDETSSDSSSLSEEERSSQSAVQGTSFRPLICRVEPLENEPVLEQRVQEVSEAPSNLFGGAVEAEETAAANDPHTPSSEIAPETEDPSAPDVQMQTPAPLSIIEHVDPTGNLCFNVEMAGKVWAKTPIRLLGKAVLLPKTLSELQWPESEEQVMTFKEKLQTLLDVIRNVAEPAHQKALIKILLFAWAKNIEVPLHSARTTAKNGQSTMTLQCMKCERAKSRHKAQISITVTEQPEIGMRVGSVIFVHSHEPKAIPNLASDPIGALCWPETPDATTTFISVLNESCSSLTLDDSIHRFKAWATSKGYSYGIDSTSRGVKRIVCRKCTGITKSRISAKLRDGAVLFTNFNPNHVHDITPAASAAQRS